MNLWRKNLNKHSHSFDQNPGNIFHNKTTTVRSSNFVWNFGIVVSWIKRNHNIICNSRSNDSVRRCLIVTYWFLEIISFTVRRILVVLSRVWSALSLVLKYDLRAQLNHEYTVKLRHLRQTMFLVFIYFSTRGKIEVPLSIPL